MSPRFLTAPLQHPLMRQTFPGTEVLLLIILATLGSSLSAALVSLDSAGRLKYAADAQGNVIPDFSHCGYAAGEKPIPVAAVKVTLQPQAGDAGAAIQAAIEKVSAMPSDKDGLRGAVLLRAGRYEISGALKFSASGVVLRGEGNATILFATGRNRRALIEVDTPPGGQAGAQINRRAITDDFVPLGARTFRVASVMGIKPGFVLNVERLSNKEWISEIGMDRIPPRAKGEDAGNWGRFALGFNRVVTAVDASTKAITVDAPLGCAIEKRWGGGRISGNELEKRIQNVGIERLRMESAFNPAVKAKLGPMEYFSDEDHCNVFVVFKSVINSWARDLTMANSEAGVLLDAGSKWITVRDCRIESFVSQITGGRRSGFAFEGQLGLFLRCHVNNGRHDFVVGSRVPGPNAFVFCKTGANSYAASEPHHRWSVAGLFDNVEAPIALQNRLNMGTGHGWSGANYVAWNCRGSLICQQPPTAQNYSFGHVGKKEPGSFARTPAEALKWGIKDGYWESVGRPMKPQSLYVQQVHDRLGEAAMKHLDP